MTASTWNIAVFRDVIAAWAHADGTDRPLGGSPMVEWDRRGLDRALRERHVELTVDQLHAAHHVLAQRSFMGGNYTLDAKAVIRILDAADGAS